MIIICRGDPLIKRVAAVCTVIVLALTCVITPVNATDDKTVAKPTLSAQGAVLLCVNNGEYILDKDSEKQMPMASTTKILTALMALEQASSENKVVTVTADMYAEGSSMYLKAGYQLTLRDLAVGMMTVSGNDAANAAALTMADSTEAFADLMNQKAQQIGMKNSNFVTPSGLDNDNHYSTARDMAQLMAYAMCNEDFAEITGQKTAKVEFVEPQSTIKTYTNHNRLLSLYQYCNGGKTGFTKKAGRCLVTSAEKDGVKLIAVTLSAGDDWNDHIKMYDYGFSTLTVLDKDKTAYDTVVPVVGGTCDSVEVSALSNDVIVVPKDAVGKIEAKVNMPKFLYAPVEKGQAVGKIVYTIDGKNVATGDLITKEGCEYKTADKNFFDVIWDFICNVFGIG